MWLRAVVSFLVKGALLAVERGRGTQTRVAAGCGEAGGKGAVDSGCGRDDLAGAVRAAGVEIGVLVDVNVGLRRCGVAPGEPALVRAKQADATKGVALRGMMGYEGHVVGLEDRAEREPRATKAMGRLLESVRLTREAGLPCEIVSAGGTGTYDITGGMEGITEIQAGSYALMDTAYAKLDIPFEQAFSVLGTVLSRPRPDQCAADCGHKACTQDHGHPDVKSVEGGAVGVWGCGAVGVGAGGLRQVGGQAGRGASGG